MRFAVDGIVFKVHSINIDVLKTTATYLRYGSQNPLKIHMYQIYYEELMNINPYK